MPAHTTWTTRQTAILCEEWAIGTTAEAIGDMAGKPKDAVIGKARRLGLPPRKPSRKVIQWEEGDKKRLLRLRREGVSWPAIAGELGRSYSAVYQKYEYLMENGL